MCGSALATDIAVFGTHRLGEHKFCTGKQDISLAVIIGIGFGGAILGGVLAEVFGVRETDGFDWIKIVFQVGFAALGVIAYERVRAARSAKAGSE